MAFWNRSPKINRIEELVEALAKNQQFDLLEDRLAGFQPLRLAAPERESWYKYRGIAAFRRGDRAAALERFREAHSLFPENAQISFSLGQEYEGVGDTQKMFALFDIAVFPAIPASHALAQARYAYLWDAYDNGLRYLQPIFDAYFKLRIADDNFLYVRGLPFFGVTWGCALAMYLLAGRHGDAVSFLESASKRLSDVDFEQHRSQLDCIRANDFSAVRKRLKKWIAEWTPQGFPIGMASMQMAVLRAQEANDASAAMQILNAISLKPEDFPWLEDIRLLATCEISARFANVELEESGIRAFMQRQALLFEPDHAVNFNLLRYQERLKAMYRINRSAAN